MKRLLLYLIVGVWVCAFAASANATATFVIQNNNGPGEGFNDPTPFAGAPGNPAATLGQARLNAFQYAADLWGACLNSNVTIIVAAQMSEQFCDGTSAVLGSAGANFVHTNFPGAPKANTWYPDALADALAGVSLNGNNPDIGATFNSALNGDQSCLGGIGWYYGFDQNPGSDIDFVTVVAHEIGHGIGFQTFQSSGGFWFSSTPDTYGCNMYHIGNVPPDYLSMTQPQRGTCNIGDPNLVWDGASVKSVAEDLLSAGTDGVGRARLHGPNPYQSGSSLSHWSPALTPNQVMEPFYTGANHSLLLELYLLQDIGWPVGYPTAVISGTGTLAALTHPNLDVNVELSNSGSNDAFNVNAVMSGGPGWLVITDPNCSYGTITAGTSENGAPDVYTLDLSGWPGGSFTVDIDVTWEDECGISYSTMVQKTFDDILTGGDPIAENRFALQQNYPNPFNPTTEIVFELKESSRVELVIFDVSGKHIRTLVNGGRPAGFNRATWDGRDDNGRSVTSGVYFYRVTAGPFEATRRMVLLK
jgi:hypothetical protein